MKTAVNTVPLSLRCAAHVLQALPSCSTCAQTCRPAASLKYASRSSALWDTRPTISDSGRCACDPRLGPRPFPPQIPRARRFAQIWDSLSSGTGP